ncbi:MbnP family protein [Owenweeksia hongkongensis]|uniref:MbnP family protein n=1 Tax=Owenweeksia hongkongensis TaxID=253245 RepID=UPI003A8DD3F1
MKSLKNLGFIALLSSVALFTSCDDDSKDDTQDPADNVTYGDFTFEIEHTFDGNTFAYNTEYTNGSGEKLEFNNLRYYISNIKLEKVDGTVWSEEESYHLIDHAVPSSSMFLIEDVPTGEYHKISYMIGIDSARNVAGAQEGALSTSNNMFWSWNTGYIFIKAEGNSLASSDSTFSYHVGGFGGPNAAQVTNSHHMHNHMLNISPNASPQMHIITDVKKLFDGDHHTISIANLSRVRMPGDDAKMVSHNLAEAFILDHIHD